MDLKNVAAFFQPSILQPMAGTREEMRRRVSRIPLFPTIPPLLIPSKTIPFTYLSISLDATLPRCTVYLHQPSQRFGGERVRREMPHSRVVRVSLPDILNFEPPNRHPLLRAPGPPQSPRPPASNGQRE